MATLRNKRKLAAVSRETPKNTRSNQSQNKLDPGMAREYISQVSEEIEGTVTRKLSKEFSRTESRILGTLSKLDEFLLNPQVRTCSVAVPGTSKNSDSENREPPGGRSLNDPCPAVVCSSHHSGHLNSSGVEECPHISCLCISIISGNWRSSYSVLTLDMSFQLRFDDVQFAKIKSQSFITEVFLWSKIFSKCCRRLSWYIKYLPLFKMCMIIPLTRFLPNFFCFFRLLKLCDLFHFHLSLLIFLSFVFSLELKISKSDRIKVADSNCSSKSLAFEFIFLI